MDMADWLGLDMNHHFAKDLKRASWFGDLYAFKRKSRVKRWGVCGWRLFRVCGFLGIV